MAESGNGVEQVEEELRETRAQLDDTLSELEHKLTPSYAVESAKEFVTREAQHAGDVARRYPYTTALATVAAGALLRHMVRRRERNQPAALLQALLAQAADKARPASSMLGSEAYGLYRDLGELAHAVQAKLRERADDLGELDVAGAASQAAQSVQQTLRDRTGDLRHLGNQLRRGLRSVDTHALRRGVDELEDRPLLLGGAMLLLGVLAGHWMTRR